MKKLLLVFVLLIPLLAFGQVGFKHDAAAYPQNITGYWTFNWIDSDTINADSIHTRILHFPVTTGKLEYGDGDTYRIEIADDSLQEYLGGTLGFTSSTTGRWILNRTAHWGTSSNYSKASMDTSGVLTLRGPLGTATDTTAYILVPNGNARHQSVLFGSSTSYTGFYGGANTLYFSCGSSASANYQMSNTFLGCLAANGGFIWAASGSSTQPSIGPNRADTNTGLFVIGPDTLGLGAGGVSGIDIREGAGNNSIVIALKGDVAIEQSGHITGNANTRGSDSFAVGAVVDSVYNLDFAAGDNFVVSMNYAPGDSCGFLNGVCVEDYLITYFTPIVAGEIGEVPTRGYNWQRQK